MMLRPTRLGWARVSSGAARRSHARATPATHRAPDDAATTDRSCPRRRPTRRSDDRAPATSRPQTGPGEFRDVVDVQLLDESLLVAARIARVPSAGRTSVTALVLADGEPVLEIAEDSRAGVDSWEHARGRAAAAHDRAALRALEAACSTRRRPGSTWTCTR